MDKGGLWVLDNATGKAYTYSLGAAKYLNLREGSGGPFAVEHHFEVGSFQITAHTFDDPTSVLARCTVEEGRCELEGDLKHWKNLPKHYVAYVKDSTTSDFALISIRASGEATVSRFGWYDDSYDKGYQGIVGVVASPTDNQILVSVQRSSKVVVCDSDGRKSGEFELAGSHGNPRLQFRQAGTELWADDYDTLLVIDPRTWKVSRTRKIQDAADGSALFIGQFSFTPDGGYCCIPRPFSGDVLLLDPVSMQTKFRARLGSQPLEAVALNDRRVFARDWKTGTLLFGKA